MDLPGFEKYNLKCQTIWKNKNLHWNAVSDIQRAEKKLIQRKSQEKKFSSDIVKILRSKYQDRIERLEKVRTKAKSLQGECYRSICELSSVPLIQGNLNGIYPSNVRTMKYLVSLNH